jgi:hypothetical protein
MPVRAARVDISSCARQKHATSMSGGWTVSFEQRPHRPRRSPRVWPAATVQLRVAPAAGPTPADAFGLRSQMLVHLGFQRSRPLDAVYPLVFIDCVFVKIRDGHVANRPVYVALAVTADGYRAPWPSPRRV